MAKKRRKKNPAAAAEAKPSPSVPKFEIGVKGDEFDLKYTRAAAAKTSDADSLLRGLSKETRISGYNLLNFAVLLLVMIALALSFAFLSRGDKPPKLSAASLFNGDYTAELSEYYKDTLPLGRAFRTLGAYLGLGEMPEPEPPEPDDSFIPEPPPVTTAATTVTEPPVTTAPPETTPPPTTPAPETTTVMTEPPETHTMYASRTAEIRLLPDENSMIMGYFSRNDEVEVIETGDDGWASIWYNGLVAYVSSDDLAEKKTRSRSTTVTGPPETEPPVTTAETTAPPETEATTEPTAEATSAATTEATTSETTYYYSETWAPPTQPPAPQTEPPTPPPETAPPETEPPATAPEETSPPETEPEQSEPEQSSETSDSELQ